LILKHATDSGTETATGGRLEAARVLVVGCGGLGSPAALALAAAGVGTLVLVDHDAVELSNLNRQLLHGTAGLGTPKVESARRLLQRRHPGLAVETHALRLDAANGAALFRAADFAIDATDGIEAKFLLNDLAVRTGTPYSHAGIAGFVGQTTTVLPGRSACYRCLFPEPPPADEVASCQESGIVGAVAGVLGSLQAAEAVRYLTTGSAPLAGHLLTYDGLRQQFRKIVLARNPRCALCGAPERNRQEPAETTRPAP